MNPIVKTQNFIDVDNKQENSVFWKKHILTKFIKCKLFIFSKFTLLSNKIQNIVNNIFKYFIAETITSTSSKKLNALVVVHISSDISPLVKGVKAETFSSKNLSDYSAFSAPPTIFSEKNEASSLDVHQKNEASVPHQNSQTTDADDAETNKTSSKIPVTPESHTVDEMRGNPTTQQIDMTPVVVRQPSAPTPEIFSPTPILQKTQTDISTSTLSSHHRLLLQKTIRIWSKKHPNPSSKWKKVQEEVIYKKKNLNKNLSHKLEPQRVCPTLKNRVKKMPPKEKPGIYQLLLMGGLLLAAGLGRGLFPHKTHEMTHLSHPISESVRIPHSPFSENVCKVSEMSIKNPTDFEFYATNLIENVTSPIQQTTDFYSIKINAEAFNEELENIQKAGKKIVTVIEDKKIIHYQDQSSYEGEIDSENRPSSDHGILRDKKGNVIREGKWRRGVLVDGVGKLLLDTSSVFIGPIRDGAPCGKGSKKSVSGEEEYIANGYGTLALENSEIFVGDSDDHFPSGYGEIISKTGDLREGIFHKNILKKQILTQPFSSSEIFRGEVDEKGQPHGFGVVFSEKGMFFGNFVQGKLVSDRPTEKSTNMLLFSAYTPERAEFNKKVIDNHKAYSEKHGYHYVEFTENLAKNLDVLSTQNKPETRAYFSKIAGMLRLLHLLDPQKIPEKYRNYLPKEFVWLDDDAVITKQSVKMEDIVDYYSPAHSPFHIFLTQDIYYKFGYDLNTAVLFVKNSKESRSVFSEIWSRRHKKTENGDTYGTCEKQSCLHEQAALQDLVKLQEYDASKYVRIIPQRDPKDPVGGWGINTFHRKSHYDLTQKKSLDYEADPKELQWKEGDFLGQATGMAADGCLQKNINFPQNLRQIFIDRLIEGEDLPMSPIFITTKEMIDRVLKQSLPGSWILWQKYAGSETTISLFENNNVYDYPDVSKKIIKTLFHKYGEDKLIKKWPRLQK